MNSKLIKPLAVVVLAGCLCAGCHQGNTAQSKAASTNEFELLDGLDEMWGGYLTIKVEAMRTGTTFLDGEFPPQCWTDPIKALHPIKVYSDVGNVVVVQKIVNDIEYGKYIMPPHSSHHPQAEFILVRSNTNCVFMSDYQKHVSATPIKD